LKTNFLLSFKGFAMGIAESIPGVSGGTIAFITGIYQDLLDSIKAFNPGLVITLKDKGVKAAWDSINGFFLLWLFSGMAIGLVAGVLGVTFLIENYPPIIWAFFFGLIIASIIHVGKQITEWKAINILWLLIGAAIAFSITKMPVGTGSESLIYIFFAGTIAISAMLLPGISGSFILLLMGVYQYVIQDVIKQQLIVDRDLSALVPIGALALGCIVGVLTFSRLLSWLLRNYHQTTLAGLTGFMIGSLNKLWPWRVPTVGLTEENQIVEFSQGMHFKKVIKEVNVLPETYLEQMQQPDFLWLVIASAFSWIFYCLFIGKA
jgi:putative membrane protein